MDIFNSQWLINMLEKSSKTPQGRILNLFDILDDWLAAPEMQVKVSSNSIGNRLIIDFITLQARNLGASSPTILAEHIVLIARNAALQEINQSGSGSLLHAKKAANALILAQTQHEFIWLEKARAKPAIYGIAATIFLLLGIGSIWLPVLLHQDQQPLMAKSLNNDKTKLNIVAVKRNDTKITAQDAVAMYAKYEQMRSGTCQFPEAIQIPDKDKAVYIENVVGGKIPTNLNDLATANAYLEKVRCSYTPMLMANSK